MGEGREWLPGGERTDVSREGNVVRRPSAPWTSTIHALLRHLEAVDFSGAPRVVGDGFDDEGHEVLTYIDGAIQHPHAWTNEGIAAAGAMLRELHDASARFTPPEGAVWQPWFVRSVRAPVGIGHGDAAPWNILARDGLPVGIIDWEFAGPIDPLVDLAQAAG
jgi:Ser/Thr protein kinase RdoA (MazF antagonist)